MARCCVNIFEVGITPEEFRDRYREGLAAGGVTEGHGRGTGRDYGLLLV